MNKDSFGILLSPILAFFLAILFLVGFIRGIPISDTLDELEGKTHLIE